MWMEGEKVGTHRLAESQTGRGQRHGRSDLLVFSGLTSLVGPRHPTDSCMRTQSLAGTLRHRLKELFGR